MEHVQCLLNENHLVQIDGTLDSYYLGTTNQLQHFVDFQHNCETKTNEHTHDKTLSKSGSLFWNWISDSDVCLAKTSSLQTFYSSSHKMLLSFQKKFGEQQVCAIHTLQSTTWKSTIQYDNKIQDFNTIDFGGYLLIGSVKAINTAKGFYDCVVNCTSNLKRPEHIATEYYLQLDWEDTPHQDILSNLVPFLQKVHNWIMCDLKRVLVFCEQGISRSAAFVLAYYLLYKKGNGDASTIEDVLSWLKTKRSIANPNSSFIEQLKMFIKVYQQPLVPKTIEISSLEDKKTSGNTH